MQDRCKFWTLLVLWVGIMLLPVSLFISMLIPYPDWYPTREKACRIAAESIAVYRRDHPRVEGTEELQRAEWKYSENCPAGYPIPKV